MAEAKKRMSVMVVDDDADICIIIKKYLLGEFQVSTYTNPALALEHFKINPDDYGLVLTDARMPSLSGLELAKEIKSLNSKTRVVLMSAFEDYGSDKGQLRAQGIDGFLRKPVPMKKIKEMLRKLDQRDGMKVSEHE